MLLLYHNLQFVLKISRYYLSLVLNLSRPPSWTPGQFSSFMSVFSFSALLPLFNFALWLRIGYKLFWHSCLFHHFHTVLCCYHTLCHLTFMWANSYIKVAILFFIVGFHSIVSLSNTTVTAPFCQRCITVLLLPLICNLLCAIYYRPVHYSSVYCFVGYSC